MFGNYNSIYSQITKVNDFNSLIGLLKKLGISKSDFLSQYNASEFGFLGSGSYGKVFKLNNRLALKLTTDDNEVEKAKRLKGKKNKNLINIYEVYDLDVKSKQGYLSIIILELCKPLPQNLMHDIHTSNYDINQYIEFNNEESLNKISSFLDKKLTDDIINMKKELESLGLIEDIDIHSGNFLMKPNNQDLCLIDL